MKTYFIIGHVSFKYHYDDFLTSVYLTSLACSAQIILLWITSQKEGFSFIQNARWVGRQRALRTSSSNPGPFNLQAVEAVRLPYTQHPIIPDT